MILGLDLSLTATGIAYWQPAERSAYTLRAPHRGIDRLRWIRDQIRERIDGAAPSLVMLEGISFGSNDSMHAEICGLHWMVRDTFEGRVPLQLVPPATLKLFATGSGRADKVAMLAAIREQFAVEVADHNQADAMALAFAGAGIAGLWQPRNATQVGVIYRIANPPGKAKIEKPARPRARRPKQFGMAL